MMEEGNQQYSKDYSKSRTKTLSNTSGYDSLESQKNSQCEFTDDDSIKTPAEDPNNKNRLRDSTASLKNTTSGFVQNQAEISVNKIAEYFRNELLMAGEDLQLLEKFNQVTREQFEEMSSTAHDLLAGGSKMQQAFSDFEPLLNQIDEISLQVDYLELVANELDEYSFELEEKVKSIRRRKELQKKAHGLSAPTNSNRR